MSSPSRDDDRSRASKSRQAVSCLDRYARGCPQWSPLQRAHTKAIPITPKLGPRQSKDLYRNAKLKSAETIVDENSDVAFVRAGHGRILSHNVISAYSYFN
jgi:hypothetical protein